MAGKDVDCLFGFVCGDVGDIKGLAEVVGIEGRE